MRTPLLVLPAVAALAVAAPAQFAITLDDGSFVPGRPAALADGRLHWRTGETKDRVLSLNSVIGLHGAPPAAVRGVRVNLVGGDELVGVLAAGDSAGETFVVKSPALGDVRVPIDRLESIVFAARAGEAHDEVFRIPEDATADEALFFVAARGFDTEYGAIHRFLDDSVLFATGEREPAVRPFEDLAAIALRGGFEREGEPAVRLLTRAGDRVGVDLRSADGDALTVVLEGGREARVPWPEVSGLSFDVEGRTFLSELTPARVEERAFFADGDVALLPHRRDRSVTGGALAAGGLAWVRGIGVHSRAEIVYRVPDGVERFLSAVAVDDEVLGLEVRGIANVAVLRGERVEFEAEVRSGVAPLRVGPFDVEPGELLTLRVDFGPGLDLGDRVDWLGAVFLP